MTKIQVRRDTASNWTSNNPTPASGEMCYETDTGKLKIGNGSTPYTNLPYIGDGGGSGGTTDYTQLTNKPQINNVELQGNKTLDDLGIQPAGNYLTEVPAEYVTETELNSKGYITSSALADYATVDTVEGLENELTEINDNLVNNAVSPLQLQDTIIGEVPLNWCNENGEPTSPPPTTAPSGRYYPCYGTIFKNKDIYFEIEIIPHQNQMSNTSEIYVYPNGSGAKWQLECDSGMDFEIWMSTGFKSSVPKKFKMIDNRNYIFTGYLNNSTQTMYVGIKDKTTGEIVAESTLVDRTCSSSGYTNNLLLEIRRAANKKSFSYVNNSFKVSTEGLTPNKTISLNYDTTTLGVNDSNQLYVKDNSGNLLEMMANAGIVTNFVLSWGTQKPTTDGTSVTVYAGTKLVCPAGFTEDGKPKNEIYTLTENKVITPTSNLILLAVRSGNNFNCSKFYIRANQSIPADKVANSWLYSKKDNRNYQYAATPTDPTFNQYDYIPAIGLIKSGATITDLVLNDNPFLGVQLYNTEN